MENKKTWRPNNYTGMQILQDYEPGSKEISHHGKQKVFLRTITTSSSERGKTNTVSGVRQAANKPILA